MIPDNGVWVEIARFYGDGANYKNTWAHFSKVNKNAKLLTQAVEAGFDPLSVELIDAPAKVQGSKGENLASFLVTFTEHRFIAVLPLFNMTIFFH